MLDYLKLTAKKAIPCFENTNRTKNETIVAK
jgi:hypothetical protein